MLDLSSRVKTTLKKASRPTSDKIIFISCEGQVTEEEYFNMISKMFNGVKSKIIFISVMKEAIETPKRMRTPQQISELGKSKPCQLVEKLDNFKKREATTYGFDKHPEDEFWIIADVDDHTDGKNIEEWNKVLKNCNDKKYSCAVSNPFFEIWLLLHHLEPNEEDYKYAVTQQHVYEKTPHYKERLRNDANAPLKDGKHINFAHYDINKVKKAIERAKILHTDKSEQWPHNLGSTVYILVDKIVEIADSFEKENK